MNEEKEVCSTTNLLGVFLHTHTWESLLRVSVKSDGNIKHIYWTYAFDCVEDSLNTFANFFFSHDDLMLLATCVPPLTVTVAGDNIKNSRT